MANKVDSERLAEIVQAFEKLGIGTEGSRERLRALAPRTDLVFRDIAERVVSATGGELGGSQDA